MTGDDATPNAQIDTVVLLNGWRQKSETTLPFFFLTLSLSLFLSFFLSYRSEEHTSELQSQFRISYAVFCLKKKKK